MSEVDELIQNPLAAVQRCFEQAVNGNSGKVPAGDWGVQQLVKEAVTQVGLQNVRNSGQAAINMFTKCCFWYLQVPFLSKTALQSGKIAPNTLVRYRGMIQDMFDPEYYVGVFHKIDSSTGRSIQHILLS